MGKELNHVTGASRTITKVDDTFPDFERSFLAQRRTACGTEAGHAGYTQDMGEFALRSYPGFVGEPASYPTGRAFMNKMHNKGLLERPQGLT